MFTLIRSIVKSCEKFQTNLQMIYGQLENWILSDSKRSDVYLIVLESVRFVIVIIFVVFSSDNLLTFKKCCEVLDPETITGGDGGNAYPLSRTTSFGVNVSF